MRVVAGGAGQDFAGMQGVSAVLEGMAPVARKTVYDMGPGRDLGMARRAEIEGSLSQKITIIGSVRIVAGSAYAGSSRGMLIFLLVPAAFVACETFGSDGLGNRQIRFF